jgi:hypothetical protein
VHFVGNCRGFVNPLLFHFHLQLRARQATVRQDRARPAAGAAAAEHPAAQSGAYIQNRTDGSEALHFTWDTRPDQQLEPRAS